MKSFSKKLPICLGLLVLSLDAVVAQSAMRWTIETTAEEWPLDAKGRLLNSAKEISLCRVPPPASALEVSKVGERWTLTSHEKHPGYVACNWVIQNGRYDHYALTFSNNKKAVVWQIDMQSYAHIADLTMDLIVAEESTIETHRGQIEIHYAAFMADFSDSCRAENFLEKNTDDLHRIDDSLLSSQVIVCQELERTSLRWGITPFAEDTATCELSNELLLGIQSTCEIGIQSLINNAQMRVMEQKVDEMMAVPSTPAAPVEQKVEQNK